MDINTLPKKSLKRILEVLGIKLLDFQLSDRNQIVDIIQVRGKYHDLISILNFMNETKRTDITDFMFKVQKTVTQHINSQQYYKDVNIEKIKEATIDLQKSLKYNKVKTFYIHHYDQKMFLSIDIESANFTVLKEISQGHKDQMDMSMTWPTYFKQLIPNDCRSASKKNIEQNIANLSFDIPNCFYESKFFRQFILGNSDKLKYLWELKNIQLLEKICKLGLDNSICINSDEIIIQIQDYDEATQILSALQVIPLGFRVQKLKLHKIDYYVPNYMFKEYNNCNKVLVNVHPEDYDKLYRLCILPSLNATKNEHADNY